MASAEHTILKSSFPFTYFPLNPILSASSLLESRMSWLLSAFLLGAQASAHSIEHPWNGPHTATYTSYAHAHSASSSSCGYPGGGPTATIDAGVVVGTSTSLPAATASVNKFLGVPFAKSPPTRFAPPENPGKFRSIINATAWSPACIQQFNCKCFIYGA